MRRGSAGCPSRAPESSPRFELSRKNASSTCSMRRRFACIFAHHLREQRALLRPPRHLVECRRSGFGLAPRLRRVQPRQHRIDLLGEIRRQVRVVLERAFGEQQRGREFHRERLGHPGFGHLLEARGERRGEPRRAPGVRSRPALASTAAIVCLSLGRTSDRPEAALSHASLALATCSRASRRIGCSRTTSALRASVEGISSASR